MSAHSSKHGSDVTLLSNQQSTQAAEALNFAPSLHRCRISPHLLMRHSDSNNQYSLSFSAAIIIIIIVITVPLCYSAVMSLSKLKCRAHTIFSPSFVFTFFSSKKVSSRDNSASEQTSLTLPWKQQDFFFLPGGSIKTLLFWGSIHESVKRLNMTPLCLSVDSSLGRSFFVSLKERWSQFILEKFKDGRNSVCVQKKVGS